MGVTIIQQFRHLGPFTHLLSSSPSVDNGRIELSYRHTEPHDLVKNRFDR